MAYPVVRVEGLTKTYGRRRVLTEVSFEVREREIFGFLGPNGAGKTTTLRLMCGLARPTAGRIQLFSEEVPARLGRVCHRMGAIVEEPAFYGHLTAIENLQVLSWAGRIRTSPRSMHSVMEVVGLARDVDRKVRTFSTGMKQRLALASALLNDPELIILDEPTAGLDPIGVREFRQLIRTLVDEGRTVLLSSHQLSEVELLCDRVALLDRGRVARYGRLSELLSRPGGSVALKVGNAGAAAVEELSRQAARAELRGDWLLLEGVESEQALRVLASAGIFPTEVSAAGLTLEDLFVQAALEEVPTTQ